MSQAPASGRAPKPVVVFDLDGTLVDTARDLMNTLNALMIAESLRPLPYEQVGTLVGAGARAMLERGLIANGASAEAERIDRLYPAFIAHYGENIACDSRPFPGVEAALDRFSAAGWSLAVCTNKVEALSLKLLAEIGWTGRFAAVCGGDTFPVRKPDPGHLTGTIARAGGVPERALMVGDSKADVDAARRAGVPVVGVSFGYTDTPIAALRPDAVIDHFDELWPAAARLGLV